MGNAGVTVYNSSNYTMNIYLSMGAIHHFCNRLKSKEAFTIYPGAVWYTVGCFASGESNDITSAKAGAQILMAFEPVVPGIAAVSYGAQEIMHIISASKKDQETYFNQKEKELTIFEQGVMNAIRQAIATGNLTANNKNMIDTVFAKVAGFNKVCHWEDSVKGIYCGGDHKILVISGGPCIKSGKWDPEDIKIRESNGNIIPKDTNFRKKNGLYNEDNEYWTTRDKEWYPPRNFNK